MKSLTLFIALFISATCCYAQPGTLDKSFGNEGIFIAGNPDGQNRPNVIAVLPDDKIIVSSTFLGTTFNGKMLARYMPDGSPDLSFGNDGTYLLSTSTAISGLAVQQDNKIVLSGSVEYKYIPSLTLIRHMPNGLLDSSFGTNGIYTDTSRKWQGALDVAIQQDGKLVTCGVYHYDIDRGIMYSNISRFHPDGRPDLSFGVEGEAIYTSSFFCRIA